MKPLRFTGPWSGILYLSKLQAFLMLGWLCVALPVSAETIGHVVFSVGEAHIDGTDVPLVAGAPLSVGQTLVTGDSGHIHIRFLDEAFVSVRPSSRLHIQAYHYDPEHPEHNRVKFALEAGTSRLITGKAGQAAKQHFRLNTPMAAIGIRGTDFIVHADAETTRVSVQQGGVVVAPLHVEGCQASAFGPCGGALSKDLAGSLTGQYLELKQSQAPALVVPEPGKPHFLFTPAHPEEPGVKGHTASTANTTSGAHAANTLQGSNWVGLPPPEGYNGSGSIFWGRWNGADGKAPPGTELVASEGPVTLYRAIEPSRFQHDGQVHFNLAQSEAYGRSGDGDYVKATVSDAALMVDFAKMKYSTSFDWHFGDLSQQFNNAGTVSSSGHFVQDASASNVSLSGALNGNGDQAGYVYSKQLPGDISAYGVMHWSK